MLHKNIVINKNDIFGISGATDWKKLKDFRSILVQVFCASEDRKFLTESLKSLKSQLPNAKIIGTSCESFIDNNKIYNENILFSITAFENSQINIFCDSTLAKDSFECGKDISSKVSDKAKVLITFADSESINGDKYLDGINFFKKDLHICGAAASSKSWRDTYVIYDTQIIENGAVAAEIVGDKIKFYNDYILGWDVFGKEFTVTEAEGKKLISVNNKSPRKIFEHYLGKDVADALPGLGSAFSFIIKKGGQFVPRGIIDADKDSLILAGEIKSGDKIYLGYANPYSIVHNNKVVEKFCNNLGKPEVIFNYYCLGRRLYLPKEIVEYELKLLNINSQVSGFFTLGEYFSSGHEPINLNFSSTILALSETEDIECDNEKYKNLKIPDIGAFGLITQGLFKMIETRSKELEKLAFYDQLTNLPNRRYLNEKIAQDIKNCKRLNEKLAILYIDLDKFKHVNDTIGHIFGDEILKELGQKLKNIDEYGAFIARFGGDEFILLVKYENRDFKRVINLAKKIIDICKRPIKIKNKVFTLGASIGIALYPNDGENAEDLIKNADTAMYHAKLKGGNRYKFYNELMTQKTLDVIKLENDLIVALQKDEFVVHYQPIYNILTKKITGAEALIRWNHPKKGILYPEDFIEFAEKNGFIDKITEIVLEKVFKDMHILKLHNKEIPKININISVKNLQNQKIVHLIDNLSKRYGISTDRISLEVTETSLIKNIDKCIESLKKLKDLGIDISIDDFGTGYSSLNYLKTLPVSSLKIDRSFISEIPYEKNDIVIVETILALADALGLNVVAEGIETKEQEEF